MNHLLLIRAILVSFCCSVISEISGVVPLQSRDFLVELELAVSCLNDSQIQSLTV